MNVALILAQVQQAVVENTYTFTESQLAQYVKDNGLGVPGSVYALTIVISLLAVLASVSIAGSLADKEGKKVGYKDGFQQGVNHVVNNFDQHLGQGRHRNNACSVQGCTGMATHFIGVNGIEQPVCVNHAEEVLSV